MTCAGTQLHRPSEGLSRLFPDSGSPCVPIPEFPLQMAPSPPSSTSATTASSMPTWCPASGRPTPPGNSPRCSGPHPDLRVRARHHCAVGEPGKSPNPVRRVDEFRPWRCHGRSRKVVGWSIADHMRSELVVDALEMARWQRSPTGTIVHADRGVQYTSWVFGHRLRAAGLLGSMGRVASSVDNALIESLWSTMLRELLDRQHWTSRVELASAIFEWIEG